LSVTLFAVFKGVKFFKLMDDSLIDSWKIFPFVVIVKYSIAVTTRPVII